MNNNENTELEELEQDEPEELDEQDEQGSGAEDEREPLADPGAVGREIARVLSDKKAEDVIMLDIRGVSVIADYFIIATGNSERQIRALYREVDEQMGNRGVRLRHNEGKQDSGWVLLDYGDVIVHIFGPQERAYYRLERLWSNAPVVLSIQ